MLIDADDRLWIGKKPAPYVPTRHVGGRIEPVLIVLHDTAGGPPGNSVVWLSSNPSQVSAHCIVEPDGNIVQLAPFDRRTNHAGDSEWQGRKGCNGFSIGIEIVNPGRLWGTPERATSSFGRSYAGAIARPATPWHKAGLWLPYTEAQLDAVEALIAALAGAYPSICDVVGHHHVAPGRKEDPTPLMPWDRMHAALLMVPESAHGRVPMAVAPLPEAAIVRTAQARLADLLYAPGSADGLMGPRTRGALRTFQEQHGLPITGVLDAHTLEVLDDPGAKPMPTGARDAATAAQVAAAGSGTVRATQVAEPVVAGHGAVTLGEAVADAWQHLEEVDSAAALAAAEATVTRLESGRSLGSRIADLVQWALTPRGAILVASTLASLLVWWLIRVIRARRVAAHQTGKQV
jgi:N-acetylmuramoyl-L-alanine amidase